MVGRTALKGHGGMDDEIYDECLKILTKVPCISTFCCSTSRWELGSLPLRPSPSKFVSEEHEEPCQIQMIARLPGKQPLFTSHMLPQKDKKDVPRLGGNSAELKVHQAPRNWQYSAHLSAFNFMKPYVVGGLEHEFDCFFHLGMSSFQLTNSYIVQRGWNQPPTRYMYIHI